MSWDVMIFNLGDNPSPSVEDLEDELPPLGQPDEIRQQISALLAGVDWSDPTCGVYEGDAYSIEFNLGSDDPITNMMLHVRGSGDPMSAIVRLAKPLGWSALDCSTSEFLDLDNPSPEGWEGFQTYRDENIPTDEDDAAD